MSPTTHERLEFYLERWADRMIQQRIIIGFILLIMAAVQIITTSMVFDQVGASQEAIESMTVVFQILTLVIFLFTAAVDQIVGSALAEGAYRLGYLDDSHFDGETTAA